MMRTLIVFVTAIMACAALLAQSTQGTRELPVPIYKPEPAYTEEARAAKISGSVTLRVNIDTDGVPREIHVIKSLDPGLDLNAIDAVGQWRFKPAMQDGRPVPFEATIVVNFKVK